MSGHPDSAPRRGPIVAVAAVLTIAVVLAGVLIANSSHRKGAPPGSSGGMTREVNAAVTSYLRAVEQRNGARLCALMSPAAQQAFLVSVAPYAQGDCRALASAALRQLPATTVSLLSRTKVLSVQASGNLAAARVLLAAHITPLLLTRAGGRWLLASAATVLNQRAASDQPASQPVPCASQLNRIAQAIAAPGEARSC